MLLAEELEPSPSHAAQGAAGAGGKYELDSHCSEIGADSSLSKCYREAACLETHSVEFLGILETEAYAMTGEN